MSKQNWFNGLTKGERLLSLREASTLAKHIPSLVLASEIDDPVELSRELREPLCVRSSFSGEDGPEVSNAGKFLSILNLRRETLPSAMEKVFLSDSRREDNVMPPISNRRHVIIQEMVRDVILSGVLFTRDPNSTSPAAVIEYHQGSETDVVTAGTRAVKTAYLSPGPPELTRQNTTWQQFQGLIELSWQLADLCGQDALDIEFALDSSGHWWILQVRPLLTTQLQPLHLAKARNLRSYEFIAGGQQIGLSEAPRLFGVMPDWNPAELIGTRPNQLALSLFRYLISDSTWAYERSNFGYVSMRGHPLLVEVQGTPFVDVNTSAKSLILAGQTKEIRAELLAAQMAYLQEHPHLHDKVEFEVYASEWTPGVAGKLNRLGVSEDVREVYESSLLDFTRKLLAQRGYGLIQSLSKAAPLGEVGDAVASQPLSTRRILDTLEACRRFGTLPFGGVARAAFISTSILRSLARDEESLSESLVERFVASLWTPSMAIRAGKQNLSERDFLTEFGHLRPGTFDILRPKYADMADLFIGLQDQVADDEQSQQVKLAETREEIEASLRESHALGKLGVSPKTLLDFADLSIAQREWLKFKFSKLVSRVLDDVADYGESQGFNREEMAHVDISDLLSLNYSDKLSSDVLKVSIEGGLKSYEERAMARLPELIRDPIEVFGFESMDSSPNFVTQKVTSASLRRLTQPSKEDVRGDMEGRIVAVEAADPGYDFVLSLGIAGLVTKYGGANSHMAIRCMELGIPAAIGIGEQKWKQLLTSNWVTIDCPNSRLDFQE